MPDARAPFRQESLFDHDQQERRARPQVLTGMVAQRRGRIIGALRMATTKPWAIDLKYFTPAVKAVYLHDVNVEPRLQRWVLAVSSLSTRSPGMACRRHSVGDCVRRTIGRRAVYRNADSLRSGARSINGSASSTSSSCSSIVIGNDETVDRQLTRRGGTLHVTNQAMLLSRMTLIVAILLLLIVSKSGR